MMGPNQAANIKFLDFFFFLIWKYEIQRVAKVNKSLIFKRQNGIYEKKRKEQNQNWE